VARETRGRSVERVEVMQNPGSGHCHCGRIRLGVIADSKRRSARRSRSNFQVPPPTETHHRSCNFGSEQLCNMFRYQERVVHLIAKERNQSCPQDFGFARHFLRQTHSPQDEPRPRSRYQVKVIAKETLKQEAARLQQQV